MKQFAASSNPHSAPSASPAALVASFFQNRQLIWQLVKREVLSRYRGSLLGLAWSFLNPLLMLAVYTFVFSVVFRARWGEAGTGEESRLDFAITLFAGLMVHSFFAECVNRAPGIVLAHATYVKRVVFPLETLTFVVLGSAFFHLLVSVLVLLLARLAAGHDFSPVVLLAPVVLAPFILFVAGLTWMLAALGVYVRDIGQGVGILVTAMLFLSPVLYPVSALPASLQSVLYFNPLTFIIEEIRDVLIWNTLPDWRGLALYTVASLVVAWIGFWWFQRARKGFADVI